MALITALIDPGEEILFLRGAAEGLARLVPLLGGRATRLPMDRGPDAAALWGAIGARTRAVVLFEPTEDELLLLRETDVTVVLEHRGGTLPEHFEGLVVEAHARGADVRVVSSDPEPARRLAFVLSLLEPEA